MQAHTRQTRHAWGAITAPRATRLLLMLFVAFGIAHTPPALASDPPIGMNLTQVTDALVDVFKTSRAFWETDRSQWIWDTGLPVPVDEDGYPTSLRPGYAARTLFMEALEGNYPTGTYTLLYDGTGHLIPDIDAHSPVYFDNGGVDNRIEFQVTNPTNVGIVVDITETDPNDHVRNIRVLRPDEDGTDYVNTYAQQPFRPLFLERIRNYGALRFMDWMGTNFSPVVSWDDRTQLSNKTWSSNFGEGAGMPYEVLVSLCNTAGISPWFCMPHMADDAYVTQFATMIRDQLDPSLDVYVEYSNEVWNGLFVDNAWWQGQSGQNSYAYEQGALRGWACGTCGFFEPYGRWVAERSVQMFGIWASVFGSQAKPDRPRPTDPERTRQLHPTCSTTSCTDNRPFSKPTWSRALPTSRVVRPQDSRHRSVVGRRPARLVEATQFAFDSGPYWAEQTLTLLSNPPYASAGLDYVCYEARQHLFSATSAARTIPLAPLRRGRTDTPG
ncbi:MAG: hypothetical protein R3E97_04685 [Candidatus Eisenbacteria bacterium]